MQNCFMLPTVQHRGLCSILHHKLNGKIIWQRRNTYWSFTGPEPGGPELTMREWKKGFKNSLEMNYRNDSGKYSHSRDVQRENSIETCILSRVKQITSPGGMHETSARAWCTGKTQRDWVEREVGRGIGMGNICKSMADSCQCIAKTTTIL